MRSICLDMSATSTAKTQRQITLRERCSSPASLIVWKPPPTAQKAIPCLLDSSKYCTAMYVIENRYYWIQQQKCTCNFSLPIPHVKISSAGSFVLLISGMRIQWLCLQRHSASTILINENTIFCIFWRIWRHRLRRERTTIDLLDAVL